MWMKYFWLGKVSFLWCVLLSCVIWLKKSTAGIIFREQMELGRTVFVDQWFLRVDISLTLDIARARSRRGMIDNFLWWCIINSLVKSSWSTWIMRSRSTRGKASGERKRKKSDGLTAHYWLSYDFKTYDLTFDLSRQSPPHTLSLSLSDSSPLSDKFNAFSVSLRMPTVGRCIIYYTADNLPLQLKHTIGTRPRTQPQTAHFYLQEIKAKKRVFNLNKEK